MLSSDADHPCGQASFPSRERSAASHSGQQDVVASSPTSQARTSSRPPARSSPALPLPPRLSKVEARALVEKCKRWLIAGSLVAFAILSGLVVGNGLGAPTPQGTPASNRPIISHSDDDGGFFQQQGGYGFGQGNVGQPPVSSSHTS